MKKTVVLFLASIAFVCSGCLGEVNLQSATQALLTAGAAATITNADLQEASKAMREKGDAEAEVARANNSYSIRLARLMKPHTQVNGIPLNYKVYLTSDINANASADGSIRVYSGLMDMMTDSELLYVLGHEIGHVANGDSLQAMRTAYMSVAARQAVGSLNATAAALSDSVLGDLLSTALQSKFSQNQEYAADAYALEFMRQNGYDTKAAVSALRKLAKISSGGGLFSSHPEPGARADRIQKAL